MTVGEAVLPKLLSSDGGQNCSSVNAVAVNRGLSASQNANPIRKLLCLSFGR